MPALRRSPLLLALALALVPAVALAVLLGMRHTTTTANKPSRTASPSPTPTPRPTPLPMLAVADRLDLGPPHAYGAIGVGADRFEGFTIPAYALTASPQGFPTALPVWKLRGFQAASIAPLAVRLGIPPTGTPLPGQTVDVAHGYVRSTTARLFLGHPPTSDDDVGQQTTALLRELGLPPLNADLNVEGSGADRREWLISYKRHALGGIQVGMDGPAATSVLVDDSGRVSEVNVDEAAADGGSMYALRDWHAAWSDITHGAFVRICCLGPNGNPGPDTEPGGSHYRFRADRVFLFYDRSDDRAESEYFVPFYGFTDSAAQLTLAVPALRTADVQITR